MPIWKRVPPLYWKAFVAALVALWMILKVVDAATGAEPAVRESRQPCPCPANTDCQHGGCPRWCPSGCQVAQTADRVRMAAQAVVRISSHGISGSVIWTGQGKSYILTCAHGHESQAEKRKALLVEINFPTPGPPKAVTLRILACDHRRDLILIELGDGPLPAVVTVPNRGYTPTRRALSVGYDKMQWPAVQAATRLCSWTYTYERPVPGRSGGALIDENGYLIGTCEGYEVRPNGRGMYVSLTDIQDFLEGQGWNLGGGGAGAGRVNPAQGMGTPPPLRFRPDCRH